MKKNKLKQNAITNQKKKKLHDRKLKGKNNKLKQNAVTEEKKKKPHEIALWGGFARKIQETRRRQGNKTQAPTPKEQKATPSRGLQGSLNSRIANSNKTQAPNKRKRHDTKSTCEGFHTKPLYGRFCDGKKIRANSNGKNKLKQNAITNQKKKKLHERKLKGKNNKLKQNAVTKEKKKKRN